MIHRRSREPAPPRRRPPAPPDSPRRLLPRERLAALGEHLGVDVQRVDHDGHPAVGGHLEDDLGHLLPRGADVQRRVDVGPHLVGPVQGRERRDGAQLALLLRDDLAAVQHAREEYRQLSRQPLVEPLPRLEGGAAFQGVEQLLARALRAGLQLRVVHERHACLLVVTSGFDGVPRRHDIVAERTAQMLNPHVFRAYDVRGLVGPDINADVFRQIGRAYATLLRRNGGRRIAVGQDNRVSSDELKRGFVAGVRAAGVSVVDIGLATTPILYFATAHWKLDGGANITGSHNPIEYNGVKMVHPGAAPLSEEEIQGLRTTIERGDYETGAGGLSELSPRDDYFDTISRIVRPTRRLKVVVDAGNGVAGSYGPELLRRIGCEVVELFCESDGSFPNHLPDPEDERNVEDLKAKVLEVGADLGIAYDGDADRVGLIDDIRQHGGVPVMWKTGHSHLKRKMRDDHILLGGEVSGHMFFAENYYGVDDGILASCKIIELTAQATEPLSRLFASIPHLRATPELKAPCADGEKFKVVEEVTRELKRRYETIDTDGARVIFPGRGWGLVRASNTNPYLTLRFEARTDREIEEMKREIYGVLSRYPFVTLPS